MNANFPTHQKEQETYPFDPRGCLPKGNRTDKPAGKQGSKRFVWLATITRGSPLEMDPDARDFINRVFMLRDIEEGVRRGNFPSGLIFTNQLNGERKLVQDKHLVSIPSVPATLIF